MPCPPLRPRGDSQADPASACRLQSRAPDAQRFGFGASRRLEAPAGSVGATISSCRRCLRQRLSPSSRFLGPERPDRRPCKPRNPHPAPHRLSCHPDPRLVSDRTQTHFFHGLPAVRDRIATFRALAVLKRMAAMTPGHDRRRGTVRTCPLRTARGPGEVRGGGRQWSAADRPATRVTQFGRRCSCRIPEVTWTRPRRRRTIR